VQINFVWVELLDGILMTKYLLEKENYIIHGITRGGSKGMAMIESIQQLNPDKVYLHLGEITDLEFLVGVFKEYQPDEIYNFAAQSSVQLSLVDPLITAEITGVGVVKILEAIRKSELTQKTKFLQVSSSEMFGSEGNMRRDEKTPFDSQNPYAAAKVYAHNMTSVYRKLYGIYACCAIAFNHESPIRGEDFVTRKITLAAARIANGLQECLNIGSLDSAKDWAHAKDFINGMWLMLNKTETAGDYILATGVSHTVREFVTLAFKHAEINLRWEGSGVEEVGIDTNTEKVVVRVDPKYFRPGKIACHVGNYNKLKRDVNWKPIIGFEDLVKEMVESDIQYVKK